MRRLATALELLSAAHPLVLVPGRGCSGKLSLELCGGVMWMAQRQRKLDKQAEEATSTLFRGLTFCFNGRSGEMGVLRLSKLVQRYGGRCDFSPHFPLVCLSFVSNLSLTFLSFYAQHHARRLRVDIIHHRHGLVRRQDQPLPQAQELEGCDLAHV